jgi:hypothetical protein
MERPVCKYHFNFCQMIDLNLMNFGTYASSYETLCGALCEGGQLAGCGAGGPVKPTTGSGTGDKESSKLGLYIGIPLAVVAVVAIVIVAVFLWKRKQEGKVDNSP